MFLWTLQKLEFSNTLALLGHLACSIHQYFITRMKEGKRRIITPLVVEEIKNHGESVDRK